MKDDKQKIVRGLLYVVESSDWKKHITLADDFGNEHERVMESCTRAIEELKSTKKENFHLGVIMEVYRFEDKDDANRHYFFNSYNMLINAGFHNDAKNLKSILKESGIDIDNINEDIDDE